MLSTIFHNFIVKFVFKNYFIGGVLVSFGEKIKELRSENGLSAIDITKKLGLTVNIVYAWEHNRNFPNIPTLIKLSKIFNVSVDYLLGLEDDESSIAASHIDLSGKEKALLKFFSILPEDVKDQVIDYTEYHANKYTKPSENLKKA